MKTQTVNLRTSPDENDILKQAAEKLSQQTGEKENISKTIIEAIKQFNESEPFFFDAFLYKNICDFYSLTQKYFSAIASDFESLKLGHISEVDFENILNSDFTDIEKRYFSSIDENLFKLQLSNSFVENNLRAGTEVPYNSFKTNTLKNLENIQFNTSRPHWTNLPLSVSILTVNDGNVTFTDDDKQRIKDKYCLIFIDTEAKREFLRMTLETLERLKKLYAIMLKNGFYNLWGFEGLFNIEPDTEEVIFYKEVLKYIKI